MASKNEAVQWIAMVMPLRGLDEIRADILELEIQTEELISEVVEI